MFGIPLILKHIFDFSIDKKIEVKHEENNFNKMVCFSDNFVDRQNLHTPRHCHLDVVTSVYFSPCS